MSSLFSRQTPEEKAADRADRAASREAINNVKKTISNALTELKNVSAKEDYPIIQTLFKDGLDWLKAHPATNQDDINDYFANNVISNPLYQSVQIRKQWSDAFTYFQSVTDNRMNEIKEKNPELLASAQELLTPMVAYRDKLLSWFNNGQKKLLPQDYEDKAVEIKEDVAGESGKEDKFKVQVLLYNTKLRAEIIEKQVENNEINITRLINKIVYMTLTCILVVLVGWGAFLGASYATNLNSYRSFNFRVFYAIFGAFFWIFVVSYELIYKKWWRGEPLHMHGYIPLFDGPVESWSWIGKNLLFFFEKTQVVDMEG